MFECHPALDDAETASPSEDLAVWTNDMDDMLRIILRQRSFDFQSASEQMRRYISQVRLLQCLAQCSAPS
jgi:hypothetical protein